jgi:hypothetical protein
VRSRLHVVRGYRELDTAANGHAFNDLRCSTEPLLGAVVHQELQGRRLKPHYRVIDFNPIAGKRGGECRWVVRADCDYAATRS